MVSFENVKAVITDLDRTLLHTDKTLSPRTAAALKACQENSHKIIAATARPLRTVLPYCESVPFDALIVSNGARILCGKQTREYGICAESAEQLLRHLSRFPELQITLETGDRAYSNLPVEEYETTVCRDLFPLVRREGALKLLVHAHRKGLFSAIAQALSDDLYMTLSSGHLLQIMSKAASKWNGVQSVLSFFGLSPEDAVYFGDDQDDLESLKRCGAGVAVSNAISEAKAAADLMTGSNDSDGVAAFLEAFLLN